MTSEHSDSSSSSDIFFKSIVVVAIVLGAAAVWKWQHPSTSFAADGRDARWDSAVADSQSTRKPALVLFTAGWCGACRGLHDDVLSKYEVQHELRKYTFITVDLTEPTPTDQARASQFGVSAIPTIIRYDAAGKEVDRTHGMDSASFVTWLRLK